MIGFVQHQRVRSVGDARSNPVYLRTLDPTRAQHHCSTRLPTKRLDQQWVARRMVVIDQSKPIALLDMTAALCSILFLWRIGWSKLLYCTPTPSGHCLRCNVGYGMSSKVQNCCPRVVYCTAPQGRLSAASAPHIDDAATTHALISFFAVHYGSRRVS